MLLKPVGITTLQIHRIRKITANYITSKEAEIKSLKAVRKYRMYWLCGAILGGWWFIIIMASQKKIRVGAQCNILNGPRNVQYLPTLELRLPLVVI
jgi:hypothetical protein